jgi:basic amino acid/polyamine antiporter, APA family
MSTELKRGLNYWTLLSLSIGSIIGTAIFFGTNIGARYSGNLAIIAWLVLSSISIYIAMCFGELVAMFPKSGGVYEYSKQTYGRFISFMTGWAAWLVGNIAVVVLSVAAVNIIAPDSSTPIKIGLSLLFILLLNLIAFFGIEATSIAMVGFAIVIITVTAAIIFKGAFSVKLSNIFPIADHPFFTIFITMFFMIETYFGWESATYLAEETKDPKKTIPKAIVNGTIIIAVLGLGIILISHGILGWSELATLDSPTTTIVDLLFGSTIGKVITAGIFIALLGSAASGIITMPRLLLALSRDKLFLEQLNAVHPTFKTPHRAILFQCLVTIIILIMGFGNYETLLNILVPLATIMYIPVILTVVILRFKNPHAERVYKVPHGKIGPIIVVLCLIASIILGAIYVPGGLSLLKLSFSIILIGVPLYFLVELYYDPKMITEVSDMFSFVSLWTESITYPKQIREEIMSFLSDIKGKTVLEFGCGVGTLTTSLLKAVGPHGVVYATHFSKNDLKIAGKRIEQLKWETEGFVFGEAKLIHDQEQFYRLHPDIKHADVIVSVGMLGYMQDVKRILKDMNQIMAHSGKVYFVEYSDFFHLLPSVEWLSSDQKIEDIFRSEGFSVRVERRRHLFWNKIFIYGFKYHGISVI